MLLLTWKILLALTSVGVAPHHILDLYQFTLPIMRSSATYASAYISSFGSWKFFEVDIVYKPTESGRDFFLPIKVPMAMVLVLSNLRPSLISCCEHLTGTTTSLLLCGG